MNVTPAFSRNMFQHSPCPCDSRLGFISPRSCCHVENQGSARTAASFIHSDLWMKELQVPPDNAADGLVMEDSPCIPLTISPALYRGTSKKAGGCASRGLRLHPRSIDRGCNALQTPVGQNNTFTFFGKNMYIYFSIERWTYPLHFWTCSNILMYLHPIFTLYYISRIQRHYRDKLSRGENNSTGSTAQFLFSCTFMRLCIAYHLFPIHGIQRHTETNSLQGPQ